MLTHIHHSISFVDVHADALLMHKLIADPNRRQVSSIPANFHKIEAASSYVHLKQMANSSLDKAANIDSNDASFYVRCHSKNHLDMKSTQSYDASSFSVAYPFDEVESWSMGSN